MSRIGRTFDELLKEREQYINRDYLTTLEADNVTNKFVTSNYVAEGVRGITTDTKLSSLFFSKKNIQSLQNQLRFRVYQETEWKIGDQSEVDLIVIMKSIYQEHSRNLDYRFSEQILELNNIVLDEIIPKLVVEVQARKRYLEDKANPYTPIDRPMNVSSAGTKSLSLDTALGF